MTFPSINLYMYDIKLYGFIRTSNVVLDLITLKIAHLFGLCQPLRVHGLYSQLTILNVLSKNRETKC